jgi:hypothetical protein
MLLHFIDARIHAPVTPHLKSLLRVHVGGKLKQMFVIYSFCGPIGSRRAIPSEVLKEAQILFSITFIFFLKVLICQFRALTKYIQFVVIHRWYERECHVRLLMVGFPMDFNIFVFVSCFVVLARIGALELYGWHHFVSGYPLHPHHSFLAPIYAELQMIIMTFVSNPMNCDQFSNVFELFLCFSGGFDCIQ